MLREVNVFDIVLSKECEMQNNPLIDFEQEFTRCWNIVEDLKLVGTDEALALATICELRFNKAWETFEQVVDAYYSLRKRTESRDVNFDD